MGANGIIVVIVLLFTIIFDDLRGVSADREVDDDVTPSVTPDVAPEVEKEQTTLNNSIIANSTDEFNIGIETVGTKLETESDSDKRRQLKKGGGVLGSYLTGLGTQTLQNNVNKIRPPPASITRPPPLYNNGGGNGVRRRPRPRPPTAPPYSQPEPDYYDIPTTRRYSPGLGGNGAHRPRPRPRPQARPPPLEQPPYEPPQQTVNTPPPHLKTEDQKLAYHYLQLLEQQEKQQQQSPALSPLAPPPPQKLRLPPRTRPTPPIFVELATTPSEYDYYDPDLPTTPAPPPPNRHRRKSTTPFPLSNNPAPVYVPPQTQPVPPAYAPPPQQAGAAFVQPPYPAPVQPQLPPQQPAYYPPPHQSQFPPSQQQPPIYAPPPQGVPQLVPAQQVNQYIPPVPPTNQGINQAYYPPLPHPPAAAVPPYQQPAYIPQPPYIPPTQQQHPSHVYLQYQQQLGQRPQAPLPPSHPIQQPVAPNLNILAQSLIATTPEDYEYVDALAPTTTTTVAPTPSPPILVPATQPPPQLTPEQLLRLQRIKLILELHRIRQLNATANMTTTETPYEFVPRLLINPYIPPTKLTTTTDNPNDPVQDLANLFGSLAVGNLAGVVDGTLKFAGTGVFNNINYWTACQMMGKCEAEPEVDPHSLINKITSGAAASSNNAANVAVPVPTPRPHLPPDPYPGRKPGSYY